MLKKDRIKIIKNNIAYFTGKQKRRSTAAQECWKVLAIDYNVPSFVIEEFYYNVWNCGADAERLNDLHVQLVVLERPSVLSKLKNRLKK